MYATQTCFLTCLDWLCYPYVSSIRQRNSKGLSFSRQHQMYYLVRREMSVVRCWVHSLHFTTKQAPFLFLLFRSERKKIKNFFKRKKKEEKLFFSSLLFFSWPRLHRFICFGKPPQRNTQKKKQNTIKFMQRLNFKFAFSISFAGTLTQVEFISFAHRSEDLIKGARFWGFYEMRWGVVKKASED